MNLLRSDPATSVLLEAHRVVDLRADLRQGGEQKFLADHPYPFLILEDCPADGADGFDLRTVASESGAVPAGATAPGSLAVPLAKSDRNAYESKITVGRARNNDVILRSQKISKFHASFLLRPDGSMAIQDMGSVNGTAVNGQRLEKGQTLPLRSGDQVSFWKIRFRMLSGIEFVQRLQAPGG